MKLNAAKPNEMVQVSQSALLSLVALKLKDRILFPKKIEEAKKFLKDVKIKKGAL